VNTEWLIGPRDNRSESLLDIKSVSTVCGVGNFLNISRVLSYHRIYFTLLSFTFLTADNTERYI
jgi:hypothetical protein